MPRFNRTYALVVGKNRQQGVLIEPPMRVGFDIKKDDGKNPNRSRIRIWNLKDSTRSAIMTTDVRCALDVGYVEEGGPLNLFTGDVTEAYTTFDKAEVITTLELGEGVVAIRDGMVSTGHGSGVTTRALLGEIAGRMNLTLSMPNDAPSRTYQNGYSYHGAGRSALDEVTRAAGLSWSIQGNTLQVVKTRGSTNTQVFELSAQSGLIGVPERVKAGKKEAAAVVTNQQTGQPVRVEPKSEKQDGWRVKSLILPTVKPADRVKLVSKTIQGVFVVKEIHHVGDYGKGDWTSELLLVDHLTAAPATPTQARQSNTAGPLPTPPVPPPAGVQGPGQ